jgi:hypothetical protein
MTDHDGWPNALTREVAEGIRGDSVALLDLLERINSLQNDLTLDELHEAAGREVAAAWACRAREVPPTRPDVDWLSLGESFMREVLQGGLAGPDFGRSLS